jgi:hypothetical protein
VRQEARPPFREEDICAWLGLTDGVYFVYNFRYREQQQKKAFKSKTVKKNARLFLSFDFYLSFT